MADILKGLRMLAVSGPPPGLTLYQKEFLTRAVACVNLDELCEMLSCKTLRHVLDKICGGDPAEDDLKVALWDWDVSEETVDKWTKLMKNPEEIFEHKKSFLRMMLDNLHEFG